METIITEDITAEDIESAYLRLKRSVYYENNVLLHLKIKLAEFENEKELLNPNKREIFFNKFRDEVEELKNKNNSEYFNNLFQEIESKKVIKKLNEQVDKNIYKIIEDNLEDLKNPEEKEEFFSRLNAKIQEDLKKDKISYNYFIDCPIELHILSVLWIMKIGYKLDLELDKNDNIYSYGYRLDMKKDLEIIKEKTIFKRYPIQYQKWKNNGIKEVEHILEKDENAVIINLDLKRFYYNIDTKLLKDKIKKIDINILNSHLTEAIFKINEFYTKKFIIESESDKDFKNERKKKNILPIGIYSSAILANIYLKDLDDLILEKVSPNYYGRYVDDLFLVFIEYNIEETKNKKKYIEKKLGELLENKILDENPREYIEKKIREFLSDETLDKNLKQDIEKKLEEFLKNETLDECPKKFIEKELEKILNDKTLNETQKNRFKEKIENILNSNVLNEIGVFFDKKMLLTNTKQKLFVFEKGKGKRELLEIEETILKKTSTFAFLPNEKEIEKLYKKISIENEEDEKNKKHDVSVYLAKLLMAFSNLENKKNLDDLKDKLDEILLFFEEDNLIKYYMYYEKIFLLLIIVGNIEKIEKFYKRVLEYFAKNNDTSLIKNYLKDSFCFALSLNPTLIKKLKNFNNDEKEVIQGKVKNIIKANLFKNDLVNTSLLSYTEFPDKEIFNFNFLKDNIFKIDKQMKLDREKIILSPRFIHFNEFNAFYLNKFIFSFNIFKDFDFYYESLKYFKLNYKKSIENKVSFTKNITLISEIDKLRFYKITSDNLHISKKIKIGIASIKIKEDLKETLKGNNINLLEKEQITEILNLAKKNKVDILVFPEVSIPYHWLGFLNRFSRENQVLITGGLRHIFNPKIQYDNETPEYVYNFLFTILPFEQEKSKMSFMTLRLKNHYSPQEEKIILGKYYAVPTFKNKKYDLFSWNGLHFSNINCFELADIETRSCLKNYIDLLIASVHNRDTLYFKNILEATSRDLHVFAVQSNNSIYGDCEILQPTNKDNMIMACIKGSQNDTLLTEELNIENLRNFQLQDYNSQKEENTYKPTPPNMNRKIVNYRKNNSLDKYFKEKKERNNNFLIPKKIPVGINDFKTLIENNYYYIDKTKYIEDLLEDGSEVILFTRPKSFGKTLNMSMIKYFFDIENKEENKKLFSGLYIEKSKHISEQGKCPVIYISFKDLKSKNWEGTIFKLKNQLKDLYKQFLYLKDSLDEISQEDFNKIIYMKEDANYEFSLKYLTEYLYKYYKQKVIVIIDEYDSLIINSYENNYYNETILFFNNFYSSTLKDNKYLEKGFLTGVLRVAKDDIFSGLNNLEVCSILDNKYSSFFGLTEDEVLKVLDYFNIEYKLNEIKDWYDGYKFGNSEIYNPYSILKYIDKKEVGAYCPISTNNFLIKSFFENLEKDVFHELELLFSDKETIKTIYSDPDFSDIKKPQNIWQLLVHSGYLTVKKRIDRNLYSLTIPNKEIEEFLKEIF